MGSDEAASLGVRNFFQVAVNQIFQVAITSWPCLASAQEFKDSVYELLCVRQARSACERVAGSGGPAEPRIASSGRDHVPCFAQCLEFTILK